MSDEPVIYNHTRAQLYEWETVLAADPTEWLNRKPRARKMSDGRVLLFPDESVSDMNREEMLAIVVQADGEKLR